MPLLKERIYTIEDIYALPEGERAELINGQMYMIAPPNRIHQKIATRIASVIDQFIFNKQGHCEVYSAPFAVFLNSDDKTYVEPDVSIICNKNLLTDKGCNGAPDWIIEIVSPGSRHMDYGTKNALYSDSGVREYWIVDPEKERVTVYAYEDDAAPSIFFFDQNIPVGIFDTFSICIDELLK